MMDSKYRSIKFITTNIKAVLVGIFHWLYNVAYSLDQFANAFLYPLFNMLMGNNSYPFGNPDETISSVMGKNIKAGHCRGCYYICRILNLFQSRHCERSIEEDEHAK